MSLLNSEDLIDSKVLLEEKPEPKQKKKKYNPDVKLTKEKIKQVELGGKTIEDEIDRPFWKLMDIDYPYEHFNPSFIMILGRKGGGKSTLAMSVPGNILGIAFEKRGNLTRPWAKIFKHDPRIQLYGVSGYINRMTTDNYRRTSNISYEHAVELLTRAIKLKKKFDWILIDGLQSTQKTAAQRMKLLNQVPAFDNLPTKLLTKWGERSMYLENLVIDLASFAATKGVILTSQDVMHKAMFLTKEQEKAGMKIEDIPIFEPAWKEKVKDDVDTIIYVDMVEKVLGPSRSTIKRYATVSSNKLGAGEGKHNITLQDDPKATINLIELLLTSDPGITVEY